MKLRANIASEHVASTLVTGTTSATFFSFEKASQLTMKECMLSSAPMSCELDPIPSKLLIECLDYILPSLTDLFNSSLASGILPLYRKSALVTPILKKRCLDHYDLNNYRPVSNQCFIAKILKKLVLSQVYTYLNSHNLHNTCQSVYLTDRTHCISLSNHCSAFAPVHSGVPQGSVLGPMLFTMYAKSLSAIIDSHSISHHSFADDLQLQMSAPHDGISELLHSTQSCISDVKAWATANMHKPDDNKTELMLVTSNRTKHLYSIPTSITMGNAQIPCEEFGFYIRLSSYYECTCLQYCSDMLF